jgi:hypothetical protein
VFLGDFPFFKKIKGVLFFLSYLPNKANFSFVVRLIHNKTTQDGITQNKVKDIK